MTEYNGWPNWETWNVNLWLSNDEPLYRETQRIAEAEGTTVTEVAEALRGWVEESVVYDALEDREDGSNDGPQGLARDLIRHALTQVHWYAIAEAFIVKV